jgi:hypothetical protein
MHISNSALGPNLQQTTKERKLPMTPRASSLSGLTARTLGWVAWQVITLVALEETNGDNSRSLLIRSV